MRALAVPLLVATLTACGLPDRWFASLYGGRAAGITESGSELVQGDNESYGATIGVAGPMRWGWLSGNGDPKLPPLPRLGTDPSWDPAATPPIQPFPDAPTSQPAKVDATGRPTDWGTPGDAGKAVWAFSKMPTTAQFLVVFALFIIAAAACYIVYLLRDHLAGLLNAVNPWGKKTEPEPAKEPKP